MNFVIRKFQFLSRTEWVHFKSYKNHIALIKSHKCVTVILWTLFFHVWFLEWSPESGKQMLHMDIYQINNQQTVWCFQSSGCWWKSSGWREKQRENRRVEKWTRETGCKTKQPKKKNWLSPSIWKENNSSQLSPLGLSVMQDMDLVFHSLQEKADHTVPMATRWHDMRSAYSL